MGRNDTRRYANWAILGALLVLLIALGVTLTGQGDPGPTRDRRTDDETATPEPADLSDVRQALEKVDAAVSERRWDDALAASQELEEQWLSYRTPMRANAGRRMWSVSAMEEFETNLEALQSAIRAQEAAPARERIEAMRATLERYDDEQSGRLETAPER